MTEITFNPDNLSVKAKRAFAASQRTYIRKRLKAPIQNHHGTFVRVDKDRPIPLKGNQGGPNGKHDHYYPFEKMHVGDSFWVPQSIQTAMSAATQFGRKMQWRFTGRSQSQDGRKSCNVVKDLRGTRIWRIA